MIQTDEINELRQISIHSILNIRNTGRRVSIPCVFHRDNTPSFSLYPDNSYHCFGCGKNGQNAIDFVMDCGYTFTEAITELNKLKDQ